jgi:hypothetical protein
MVSLEFSGRTTIRTGSPALDDKGAPFGCRERRSGAAPAVIAGTLPSPDLLRVENGPAFKAGEDSGGILCVLATSVRPNLCAARVGQCAALAQHAQSVPAVPRSGVLSKAIRVIRLASSSSLSPLLRRTPCLDTSLPKLGVVFKTFLAPSLSSFLRGTTLLGIASEPLSVALLGKRLRIISQSCHPLRCRSAASGAVAFRVVSVTNDPGPSTRFGGSLLLTRLASAQ